MKISYVITGPMSQGRRGQPPLQPARRTSCLGDVRNRVIMEETHSTPVFGEVRARDAENVTEGGQIGAHVDVAVKAGRHSCAR